MPHLKYQFFWPIVLKGLLVQNLKNSSVVFFSLLNFRFLCCVHTYQVLWAFLMYKFIFHYLQCKCTTMHVYRGLMYVKWLHKWSQLISKLCPHASFNSSSLRRAWCSKKFLLSTIMLRHECLCWLIKFTYSNNRTRTWETYLNAYLFMIFDDS